jgi:hypothetical protein
MTMTLDRTKLLGSPRAGLRQMIVVISIHFVSLPLPPDSGTVNPKLAVDLRIRDAPFREDLNLYPIIHAQASVCCHKAPPVA